MCERGKSVSSRRQAIVRAVIGLGRSLRMPVVAEGVETEEQRSALIELGCHLGQGYLLGRPAPLERIIDALDEVAA